VECLFFQRSRAGGSGTCQFPESQEKGFEAEQILLHEVTIVQPGPQATAGHSQQAA